MRSNSRSPHCRPFVRTRDSACERRGNATARAARRRRPRHGLGASSLSGHAPVATLPSRASRRCTSFDERPTSPRADSGLAQIRSMASNLSTTAELKGTGTRQRRGNHALCGPRDPLAPRAERTHMPLVDPVIERVLADFERRAEEEQRRTARRPAPISTTCCCRWGAKPACCSIYWPPARSPGASSSSAPRTATPPCGWARRRAPPAAR